MLDAEKAVPVLKTIVERLPSLEKRGLRWEEEKKGLANALAHALLQTNHSTAIPVLEQLEREHGVGTEALNLLKPERGFEAAKNLLEGETPNAKGVDKMRELAKRGHEPAIRYLVDNVRHSNEEIRNAMQSYVAALKHPLALPALSDLADHPQTAVRTRARETVLTLAQHPEAQPILEQMLAGAARAEKATILQAISQHHGADALQALQNHPDEQVRGIAMGMLKGMEIKTKENEIRNKENRTRTQPKPRPRPRP